MLARRFHAATKHDPRRPGRGGPFDPAIEPDKVKRYRDADRVPLPRGWEPDMPAAAVLSGATAHEPGRLDLDELARLVFLSNGITRRIGGRGFRAAPSAGALYPVELYVVCGDLPGLDAGVYHHDPEAHLLHRLSDGDLRAPLGDEAAACPASLVLTGIPWRTTWKYGPRGYRHLFWDAGVMLANTLGAADAAGIRTRALTGFVDAEVGALLDLGEHLPFAEWPLVVVPLGQGDAPPAPAQAVEPLQLEVEPLSPTVMDEREAAEAHAAGQLHGPDEVARFRRQVGGLDLPAAAPVRLSAPDQASGTIDEVVLRRGSTRAFDPRQTAAATALDWGLAAACRPVSGDLAAPGCTPLAPYVAVHAVEGTPAGGYRWASSGLDRVVEAPRHVTAHLCLDQALGGTSAFTVFFCADLDGLLDTVGDRGYRTAQLAAGIAAGRLQLAAFALGLGGTGLTFYDDVVRAHFGTDAEPLLVAAAGIPAYRARPGRRPAA